MDSVSGSDPSKPLLSIKRPYNKNVTCGDMDGSMDG